MFLFLFSIVLIFRRNIRARLVAFNSYIRGEEEAEKAEEAKEAEENPMKIKSRIKDKK